MKRKISCWSLAFGLWMGMNLFLAGCSSSEMKPVDIFPEDNCGQCRMAVSDERFASEIIEQNGEVYKFDDLGCMLKYRAKHADLKIGAIYLKDYDTKRWTSYERAAIVETDVETPMGSGKVAFADSVKAREFQKQHPSNKSMTDAGCGMSCCADGKD